MSYRAITVENSPQYHLTRSHTSIDEYGRLRVGERVLVALGREYGVVGDKLDLKFSGGEVLEVIIGDIKHQGCNSGDGSQVEFIISREHTPTEYLRNNFNELHKGHLERYRKYGN